MLREMNKKVKRKQIARQHSCHNKFFLVMAGGVVDPAIFFLIAYNLITMHKVWLLFVISCLRM